MIHLPSHAGCCYVGLVAVAAAAAAVVEPAAAEGRLLVVPSIPSLCCWRRQDYSRRENEVSSGGGRYASCSSRRTLTETLSRWKAQVRSSSCRIGHKDIICKTDLASSWSQPASVGTQAKSDEAIRWTCPFPGTWKFVSAGSTNLVQSKFGSAGGSALFTAGAAGCACLALNSASTPAKISVCWVTTSCRSGGSLSLGSRGALGASSMIRLLMVVRVASCGQEELLSMLADVPALVSTMEL